MAEEEKKVDSKDRVNEKQRFSYIGFEVFPGNPKDLFKSDAEKEKLTEAVIEKRSKGEILRESCTLLGDRVSFGEKLILTVTSLVIIAALFLPWYTAYNEITEEVNQQVTEPVAVVTDSLNDSVAVALTAATEEGGLVEESVAETIDETVTEPVDELGTVVQTEEGGVPPDQITTDGGSEELLHSYVAKKKVHKEYDKLTGLGAIASLGSVGSMVFSSGFIVIITGLLFIIYTLLCIALPAYSLYGLYGSKGDSDKQALNLKKIVRFNWIPVIIFLVTLLLSFIGGSYGFDSTTYFSSLGDSYGPGVFLGSLSWGVFVSMAGFILIAVKGVEI